MTEEVVSTGALWRRPCWMIRLQTPIPGPLLLWQYLCSHLPWLQALWAQFKPDTSVSNPYSWSMSKIGSPISPLEVVRMTSVLMLCLKFSFASMPRHVSEKT